MSYREPAPRPKRLWYVVLVAVRATDTIIATTWVWAKEASDAVVVAREEQGIAQEQAFRVVCGEDFAEREIAERDKAEG